MEGGRDKWYLGEGMWGRVGGQGVEGGWKGTGERRTVTWGGDLGMVGAEGRGHR